jgi:hypothetical protein
VRLVTRDDSCDDSRDRDSRARGLLPQKFFGPPDRGTTVVALVQRHPGRQVPGEIEPLRQERRFTEPGWCGDERQLQLRSAVQALLQSRTWDQTAAHLGEVDLGLQQQVFQDQLRNAPCRKPWGARAPARCWTFSAFMS